MTSSALEGKYDCVVIGSGIAGSMSALCMARCGIQTLVVEEKSHPRFAIGESTVPTTSFGFYHLAETYRVPELRDISHYLGLKRAGCTAWPKQSFHFNVHQEGKKLPTGDETMLVTLPLPIGPDVHMLRADADSYLASRLPAYGVDYVDRTSVTAIEHEARRVRVTLQTDGARREVRTRFILDCSGHASFLAHRYGLREPVTRLRTNTRTIFSHFRGIPSYDDLLGGRCPLFGRSRDSATIHHCFEGGWIWVIRFDSGVVSVGLTLDRDVYPDNDRPAEEEFRAFIKRFPTVYEHLGEAEAIRPFVKTGRIQFSSRTTVGDRFMLTPHAAGFVDPLYSSGMNLTQAFVARFIPIIREAMAADDFRAARFEPIDRAYQEELDTIDEIVHGSFKSFRHFDTFKQFWRTWVYATLTQDMTRAVYDLTQCDGPTHLYGASSATWRRNLRAMHDTLLAHERDEPRDAARHLREVMNGVREPFTVGNWEVDADEPCRPDFRKPTDILSWLGNLVEEDDAMTSMRRKNLAAFGARALRDGVALWSRYGLSRVAGPETFSRAVDLIQSHQFPAKRQVS